uniref:Hypothetical chloroplast RF20 n=1 Tax=Pseudochloris wilhelmii TaxID=1418016 RepID=A0A097KQT9_9CHLO|nr:hypothetical chloroplast RF20 [Pseudochloris wilhelmii]AIT95546.1 hypothetical chloroplast RF20 [Pseudochloris wilhelmii]
MNIIYQFEKTRILLCLKFNFKRKNLSFFLCAFLISFCCGNLFGLLTKQFGLYTSLIALALLELWNIFFYSACQTKIKPIEPVSSSSYRSSKIGKKILHAMTRGFLLGLYVDAFKIGS